MRVLFLTQIVPYPPDAGPKVKTYHVLRYLVEAGHEVVLVSYVRADERPHLPALEKLCAEVHAVPIKRSRFADLAYMARSFLTGRPFLVERDDLPEMRQTIRKLVDTKSFDIIHTDQLTMAQFAFPTRTIGERFPSPTPILVFDAHNAVWAILDRSKDTAFPLLKPILAREARLIAQHEAALVSSFEHTLAVSTVDKEALLQAIKLSRQDKFSLKAVETKISVIPIAVDTQTLQPVPLNGDANEIVTLGTLHYPPNADGIRWFMHEVFPIISEKNPLAHLTIIGKNPPADFIQAAADQPQAITVTGYVDDLTPYMEKATVMVVPVRAGGGMRVRILEAFARGMPVVTTTVGLEGINALPNSDVLVEDTPSTFAQAVLRVLEDPELRINLAKNGRKLAETTYDWQVVLHAMERVYSRQNSDDNKIESKH
jgi:polysaccharide biosynthesis protein PslH